MAKKIEKIAANYGSPAVIYSAVYYAEICILPKCYEGKHKRRGFAQNSLFCPTEFDGLEFRNEN